MIFVHGLGGDMEKTWSTKSKPSQFWPHWLSEDLHSVAVWTLGYPASAVSFIGNSMDVLDRGANAFKLLLAEPALAEGKIILVGHSMGGLVSKSILRCAATEAQTSSQAQYFCERVAGLAFLGTPHLGSFWSNLKFRRSNASKSLELHSPSLRDLNNWYRQYARTKAVRSLVLVESQQTFGARIVNPTSSDPGVVEPAIHVDSNHVNIAKPSDREAEVFIHLRNFVGSIRDCDEPVVSPDKVHEQQLAILAEVSQTTRHQSHLFEGFSGQISDLSQLVTDIRNPSAGSVEVLDEFARKKLITIRTHRFLSPSYSMSESKALSQRVLKDDLTAISKTLRTEILAWSSRILAKEDNSAARGLLDEINTVSSSAEVSIAKAFVDAFGGDSELALENLGKIDSPAARTAQFVITINRGDTRQGLGWLKSAGLGISDLDSDGKHFLFQALFETSGWGAAQSLLGQLDDADYAETPVLLFDEAMLNLASCVKATELREALFSETIFLHARDFPLSDEPESLHRRKEATKLFELFFSHFKEFNEIADVEIVDFASDMALWLRLRDPETCDEARADLKRSMGDESVALRRVPLAIQFGLNLDKKKIETQIDKASALRSGKPKHAALARFAIALIQESPQKVLDYLSSHKTVIEAYIDSASVNSVEIDVLSALGYADKAKRLLNEMINAKEIGAAQERALLALIAKGEGQAVADSLIAEFQRTDHTDALKRLVIALTEEGDWERLCEFAEEMYNRTQSNADAVVLAKALYKAHHKKELVEFLANNERLAEKSAPLQELLCYAQFDLGQFQQCRSSLSKYPAVMKSHNMLLLQIAIASGDWEAAGSFVEREWEDRDSKSPTDLLKAAHVAQRLNSARVKDLVFEAASKAEDSPGILVACYTFASELGWDNDDEISKWLQSAQELSDGSGPLQKFSLEELVKEQPKWADQQEKIYQQLAEGELPNFIAAQKTNGSLLNQYFSQLDSNRDEKDPRKWRLLLVGSGARGSIDPQVQSIVVDPTSLLFAESIGFADALLNGFEKIFIAHETLPWLFEEKQRLPYHQKSKVKQARAIRDYLSKKQILELKEIKAPPARVAEEVGFDLARLIESAFENQKETKVQSVVIHPYPIHKVGTLMREEARLGDFEEYFVSVQGLVAALEAHGAITKPKKSESLNFLNAVEKPWPDEPLIGQNSAIFLDPLGLSYLQHLGLLPALTNSNLTVYVSPSVIDESDNLIDFESFSMRAEENLDSLRKRLRDALTDNKVVVSERVEKLDDDSNYLHPTMSILSQPTAAEAYLVDDRFLNRAATISLGGEDKATLTSWDVLKYLHQKGLLTSADLVELRAKIRRSGCCFIPVEEREIADLIKDCKVVDGRLAESAELKALKQSVLRVRMSDVMQLPKELPWFQQLINACIHALRSEWVEGVDINDAKIKSDWVLSLMNIENWSHAFARMSTDSNLLIANQAFTLAELVVAQPQNVREAYWDWYEDRVLETLKKKNSTTFATVVNKSKNMFKEIVRNISGENE